MKVTKNQASRVAMSSVDKAWLRMDRPTNLMIINGVMLFDEVLDFTRFKTLCEQRLVGQYERFRQRVIELPASRHRFYWETDPYFDIRSHLYRFALPDPGDTATLQALISTLMSEALDSNKPLWRFYLIENVQTEQGGRGCALLGRFHHCIADGIALIQVLLSLTDLEPTTTWTAPPATAPPKQVTRQFAPLTTLWQVAQKAQTRAVAAGKTLLYESIQTLDQPAHALELAQSAGILTAASAAILAKLLLLPPDRASLLKGPLSTSKQVAWSRPLALAEVKAIGLATESTINDVLIAGVAGGLRRYLQAQEKSTEQSDLRAMVPVNLRAQVGGVDAAGQLGNHFSLVYLDLPISTADPCEQLRLVKARMDLLKQSPEPLLVYQVLHILGSLPGELADFAIRLFASKATTVLTNVPGPRQVLYFAGQPLRRLLFWVPQTGEIGIGLSIISYAGLVTIGLVADEQLAPQPQTLIEQIHTALLALAAATGTVIS